MICTLIPDNGHIVSALPAHLDEGLVAAPRGSNGAGALAAILVDRIIAVPGIDTYEAGLFPPT